MTKNPRLSEFCPVLVCCYQSPQIGCVFCYCQFCQFCQHSFLLSKYCVDYFLLSRFLYSTLGLIDRCVY
jgi:hypothetical protein